VVYQDQLDVGTQPIGYWLSLLLCFGQDQCSVSGFQIPKHDMVCCAGLILIWQVRAEMLYHIDICILRMASPAALYWNVGTVFCTRDPERTKRSLRGGEEGES